MKNANIRYNQPSDSDVIVSYEVSADGAVAGTFTKPAGQVDGAEQAVVVALSIGAGSHSFTLDAVEADGTKSTVSNAEVVTFPLAAPVLVAVEPQ